MNCKNCQAEVSQKYCSHCGQKKITDRFSLKGVLSELIQLFTNIEKGFWLTVKMLFTNPATLIKNYLNGITIRYYNPFRYLIIWTAIAVFLNLSLGLFDLQQEAMQELMHVDNTGKNGGLAQQVNEKMRDFLNLFPLLHVPFLALFSFWVFRKQGWNYAEHLIAYAYLFGQISLMGILNSIFVHFNPAFIFFVLPIALTISWIYLIYVYRQLFDIGIFSAIWKAFIVTLGGYLGIILFVSLSVGILIFIFLLFKRYV